jgi:hypothetical protein
MKVYGVVGTTLEVDGNEWYNWRSVRLLSSEKTIVMTLSGVQSRYVRDGDLGGRWTPGAQNA